MSNVDF